MKLGLRDRFRTAFRAIAFGQAVPPWDDYWYQRPGFDSAAGMAVSPETAMRLAAVFACVRVRSESLAASPFIIFKRLPNGGKERAPNHPLYRLLHSRPNIWQTSLEFFEMMQAHLDLRGNAFARILEGPSGPVDQLVPLHPDLVQVYRLPNGRLKYQVRSRWQAEVDYYTQEEILHVRGLSSDGLVGLSPIAVQRETIGTGLGLQDYGGRFFANDSKPSFVLEHPGKFKNDEDRQKFRESMQKSQTQENRHKMMVLESGMKATALGVSNKDSQFLEARQATSIDICGMYRVPPHKVGLLDRATHSNIEHQGIEFVSDCMRPAAIRWEHRINSDLITPVSDALESGDEYFGEFLLDGLIRGPMAERYKAYSIGRLGGWLCPDDICASESMNPLPEGKGGQDYLRPVNCSVVGAPQPALPGQPLPNGQQPAPGEPSVDDPPPDVPDDAGGEDAPAREKAEEEDRRLLGIFAREAAGRVVRKEVAALRKALARSTGGFESEARMFYASHFALVAQTMSIDPAVAANYCNGNLAALLEAPDPGDKASILDWIEDTAPEQLAGAALGRANPDRNGSHIPAREGRETGVVQ